MKIERIQPPATIKIEIDEGTAEKICALLGVVAGDKDVQLRTLYYGLDGALPNRECTFSDFFTGMARCK
jgi:hypothetical protein